MMEATVNPGPAGPGAPVAGPARLLVLGGGYTGQRFAGAARRRGLAVRLSRRTAAPPATPQVPPGPGHEPGPGAAAGAVAGAEAGAEGGDGWLCFDSRSGLLPQPEQLAGTTHLLVSVPPDGEPGDPVLRLLGPWLQQLSLQWVGYLSTTGVYGDTGGAWVDETAPTPAPQARSRARLAAEQAWRASGLPVQIFRLPAIYGPGRSPFAALARGESRLIHKPGQVFSRIHVDDIVGTLLLNLALPAERRPPVLNVSDDCPCSSSEALSYAAHLVGCKLPALQRYGDIAASLSPMARSFWEENRRAGNRLLCQQLGYRLRYPSYREGYRAALREETSGVRDWGNGD